MNDHQDLWRDAILDQIADAKCAIGQQMLDYARECLVSALAMLDDAMQDKPASLILSLHLKT